MCHGEWKTAVWDCACEKVRIDMRISDVRWVSHRHINEIVCARISERGHSVTSILCLWIVNYLNVEYDIAFTKSWVVVPSFDNVSLPVGSKRIGCPGAIKSDRGVHVDRR